MWFYKLSQEEKQKIETFFGSNLEKGQLTADGSMSLMQDYDLNDKQMDELQRYLVVHFLIFILLPIYANFQT